MRLGLDDLYFLIHIFFTTTTTKYDASIPHYITVIHYRKILTCPAMQFPDPDTALTTITAWTEKTKGISLKYFIS